jgi:hypothetical protein
MMDEKIRESILNLIQKEIQSSGLNERNIIYYGEVVDVDDPLNLGRLRVEPKDWQIKSYKNANPIKDSEKWTTKDPFVYLPLLPVFLYQVPKKGEWVNLFYSNPEYEDRNKYYIQGGFSSINKIRDEEFNSSIVNTALGERIKQSDNIRPIKNNVNPDTTDNQRINNPQNLGLYPNPDTIALLGRYNSDILLPEGGIVLRSNKIGDTPDINPTFNKRHGFNMIQKYGTRKERNGTNVFLENNILVQKIQYLIEYNVYGGLGTTGGLFSGYINVFKISPYNTVFTNQVNIEGYTEFTQDQKIGPIYRDDFVSKNFETVVAGINSVIKRLNNSELIIGGSVIENPFPFVFQPEKQFFELFTSDNRDGVIKETYQNAENFIKAIYLTETDTKRGYSLVGERNKLGKNSKITRTEIEQINEITEPITYGVEVVDRKFLLSHLSQIPGLNKIDFQDANFSGDTYIDNDFIFDNIIPNTNSMVRGEKLIDLLELIIKYLITHVHPNYNMAPDTKSLSEVTNEQLLTKIFQARTEILNENIRIN